MPLVINLENITKLNPKFSAARLNSNKEACIICLNEYKNKSGCILKVEESKEQLEYKLNWKTKTNENIIRSWADKKELAERGAEAMAIMLVSQSKEYELTGRSPRQLYTSLH